MESTIKTFIEFVKYNNGEQPIPTETSSLASTGDFLWVIFAILTIFSITSFFFIRFKIRQYYSVQGNIYNKKNDFLHFASFVFLASTLIFSICSILNFSHKANADIINSDKIQIQIDEQNNQIYYKDAKFINNTGISFNFESIDLKYTDDFGLDNVIWKLDCNNNNIYNGTIPGSIKKSFTLDNETNIHVSTENLDINKAKELINKDVVELNIIIKDTIPAQTYEFTPNPLTINYDNNNKFYLYSKLNIVSTEQIDQSTKNHLENGLSTKHQDFEYTNMLDNNKQNIYLHTNSSLNKNDEYNLKITRNCIDIEGNNTEAVFMGITSLNQILQQTNEKAIQGLNTNDYANTKYRGFIEGYYGIPWSNNNRISLMEFASQFKMNTYIFAPKDDKYHSAEWRTPYPEDKLNEMRQLVETGIKTKVNFTWAIHPFMENPISFDTEEAYEKDRQCIFEKYQQLYNIGVRNFGLSADDCWNTSPENQAKLIEDLNKWCIEKGDCAKFLFVPQYYNKAWSQSEDAKYYINIISSVSNNVDIMWTGDSVMSPVTTDTCKWFKDNYKRDAYIWWNFPVNDYCKNHLLMGKAEWLIPNATGFTGLVSNPMQQAQASKVALFSTANYAWNNINFDAQKIVEKSYKFIDSGSPIALSEICKHLCYSSNRDGMNFEESENMKEELEKATLDLNNNQPIDEQTQNILVNDYRIISQALNEYNSHHANNGLYEEMQPWLNCLHYEVNSALDSLDAIKYLKIEDKEKAKSCYETAKKNFETSKTFEVPKLAEQQEKVFAEAGSKRLIPFQNTMLSYLEKHL